MGSFAASAALLLLLCSCAAAYLTTTCPDGSMAIYGCTDNKCWQRTGDSPDSNQCCHIYLDKGFLGKEYLACVFDQDCTRKACSPDCEVGWQGCTVEGTTSTKICSQQAVQYGCWNHSCWKSCGGDQEWCYAGTFINIPQCTVCTSHTDCEPAVCPQQCCSTCGTTDGKLESKI